jgi:Uncharacterized alpha/beta hydrolase domain (DUF2235)
MRYYAPGDDIFIFGFSRGAYTARFLAEMLDDVGLLPHGNEEMVEFAWKTFAKWQMRRGSDMKKKYHFWEYMRKKHDEKRKKELDALIVSMQGFKDTFSRDIKPIRLLGLFDTVNSVPQFEAPWMDRKKFPYTARSAAREIWHAVSIDERRVNFRADLLYQSLERPRNIVQDEPEDPMSPEAIDAHNHQSKGQQVHEVWFMGNHGDVGGGWAPPEGKRWGMSHVPLVWMVRAAYRAGVKFNPKRLQDMGIELEGTHDHLFVAPTNGGKSSSYAEGTSHRDDSFHDVILQPIHDCLSRTSGLVWHEVLRWNIAEHIPFRRMHYQNGKWTPIRLPLPLGGSRDIPKVVKIHGSVFSRMADDKSYRPGNLILGDGRKWVKGEVVEFNPKDWQLLASSDGKDYYEQVYIRGDKSSEG